MAVITYPTYVYGYKYTPVDLDMASFFATFTKNVVIDHNDFTVSGDGVFDDLMETATKHLAAQFEAGRIRGENYAEIYAQIYIATLQALINQWTSLAIENKRLEVQLAMAREANESAERQNDARLASQERMNAADIASKEKISDHQLEIQWRIALLNNDLQRDIADAQLELLAAQKDSEDAKKALYMRQIEAFDEGFKEKIFKQLIDAWVVGFSIDDEAFNPSYIFAGDLPPEQGGGKGNLSTFYENFILPEIDIVKYPVPEGAQLGSAVLGGGTLDLPPTVKP